MDCVCDRRTHLGGPLLIGVSDWSSWSKVGSCNCTTEQEVAVQPCKSTAGQMCQGLEWKERSCVCAIKSSEYCGDPACGRKCSPGQTCIAVTNEVKNWLLRCSCFR